MSLTRITTGVISSNAVSAAKLSNGSITSRTIPNATIELRHLASNANAFATTATLSTNLTANLVQITANINAVQANVNAQTVNVNIIQSNLSANIGSLNTGLIQTNANVNNVAANVIRLTANVDIVQDNVAAIIDGSTAFTGEVTMNDDLIVTGNLIVSGDTTTANSINMIVEDRIIMLANSATGSPADDIGFLFNRGNQGNAAFFYDESAKTFKISDTKDPFSNTTISPVTASNLDVGILTAANVKYSGTDLHVSIIDNVAALTTNINTLDANADAIESRRVTNVSVAASNDFVTFTRLNANLNVVQDNVAALSGSLTVSPFVNVNTATGTSNAFFVGKDTSQDDHILTVSLDGLIQSNNEFVYHHSNNTIQFKDASIPSGIIVQILSAT